MKVALSPNATIVARDLAVEVQVAPGGTETRTFTLRDDAADTAVKCVITGASKTCNSGIATATISPASKLSLKLEKTAGAAGLNTVSFSWRAVAP